MGPEIDLIVAPTAQRCLLQEVESIIGVSGCATLIRKSPVTSEASTSFANPVPLAIRALRSGTRQAGVDGGVTRVYQQGRGLKTSLPPSVLPMIAGDPAVTRGRRTAVVGTVER